ncbi:hypothetical protein Btru_076880 [Bulinus truncatus]|nr:hypothetical protein Btru_076880 [Bulinus truncatus]
MFETDVLFQFDQVLVVRVDYTSDMETELKNLFFVSRQTEEFVPEIKHNSNMLLYLYVAVTIFVLVVKPKRKRPDTVISQVYSTVNLQVCGGDNISREEGGPSKIQNDSSSTCDHDDRRSRPRHVIPPTSPFQSCLTYQDISSGDNRQPRKAPRPGAAYDDDAPATQFNSTISKTTSSACYKDNVVTEEPPMITMELYESKPSNVDPAPRTRTQEGDAVKQKTRSSWTLCTDQQGGDRRRGEADAVRLFELSGSSKKIVAPPLVLKQGSHVVCRERGTVESRTTCLHRWRKCTVLGQREDTRQGAVIPVVPPADKEDDTRQPLPLRRLVSLVTKPERDDVDSHTQKYQQHEDSVYTTWETEDKNMSELETNLGEYHTKQMRPSGLNSVPAEGIRTNESIVAGVFKKLRSMKQMYKLTAADYLRYQEAKYRLLRYFNIRAPITKMHPLHFQWGDCRKQSSARQQYDIVAQDHQKVRDCEKNHNYENFGDYKKISGYETVCKYEEECNNKIVRGYEKANYYKKAKDYEIDNCCEKERDYEKDHERNCDSKIVRGYEKVNCCKKAKDYKIDNCCEKKCDYEKDHDNEIVRGYKKVRSYEKVRMIESLTSLKDICPDAHKGKPQVPQWTPRRNSVAGAPQDVTFLVNTFAARAPALLK